MNLLSTSVALRCHRIRIRRRCSGCSHCSQVMRMLGRRKKRNMMIGGHHNGCYMRDSSPAPSLCDGHFSVPCIVPSESLSLSL
jgi:dissimilatory sulfite reductase (desulfoviridin) alpha/beta subunit